MLCFENIICLSKILRYVWEHYVNFRPKNRFPELSVPKITRFLTCFSDYSDSCFSDFSKSALLNDQKKTIHLVCFFVSFFNKCRELAMILKTVSSSYPIFIFLLISVYENKSRFDILCIFVAISWSLFKLVDQGLQ